MNLSQVRSNILENSKKHQSKSDKFIQYGTAGFRDKAELLDHVMFRVGILSSLRSKQTKATIGVVITASHNPEEDNGVKLVDPMGELLEPRWEEMATKITNYKEDKFLDSIIELITNEKIDLNEKGSVYIGRDTRKSSPTYVQSVIDGINSLENNDIGNFGLTSTPMIHYFVVCKNTNGIYGINTHEGYYDKLSNAFIKLMNMEAKNAQSLYNAEINLDAANGVGSLAIKEFQKRIDSVLKMNIFNDGSGILNYNCGADYIKIGQKAPENLENASTFIRCLSLDGDADRIIYFYFDDKRDFKMLDGDKIATLCADHLGDLVKKSGLNLKLGLVQTAYANGSSTNYIMKELGITVSCVSTGVKYLHHEAQQYDIGVYFEANGHGTVVFSDLAVKSIKEASGNNEAALELSYFLDVINSTNGDAISDLLTVEAILHSKGWNIQTWDAQYTDLPNRQLKIKVEDRNIIKTADAERICTDPVGVQEKIDFLMKKYINGRSFIRPSGTEDIVRVYAEADTQKNADLLANEVAQVVNEFCRGMEPRPKL